jgi:hypothetical protein
MPTLVLLSGSHVVLTLDEFRASLGRAFPGEFLPQHDDRSFIVEGEEPGGPYFIKSSIPGAEGLFLFHNRPGLPEDWTDEDFDDSDDLVFRRLTSADHGWMSINMLKAITTEAAAYCFMVRALAEIAPCDAGFLLCPSRGVVAFDEKARRAAAAGRDPFTTAQ